MYSFNLDIAGFCIDCKVNYEYSLKLCRNYITDKPAELFVFISLDDIAEEISRYDDSVTHSEAYMESLVLYRKICSLLSLKDTALIHGSSLMMDNEVVLFCAKSGTGKSTHAKLWREVYGDKVVMINDDKPLIRIIDGIPMICGTPWDGKHRISRNISVPLKHICFLERGGNNMIIKADHTEALPKLLAFTFRPDTPAETAAILETTEKIAGSVKFWNLKCNMDPEAAIVSHDGMFENAADN